MAGQPPQRYRNYILDRHAPPPDLAPSYTLAAADIAEEVQTFRAAGCDSTWCYAKDHWGYAWYESRVGRRRPGAPADWLAEYCRAGQRAGLEVVAYYSWGFDNLACIEQPDWAMRDTGGRVRRLDWGRGWYYPCASSPYRAYALAQLREIAAGYPVDGVFVDNFEPQLCYCRHCDTAYRAAGGVGIGPPAERSVAEHRRLVRWIGEAYRALWLELRRVIEEARPGTPVVMQGPGLHMIPLMPGDYLELSDDVFGESRAGMSATGAWLRGARGRPFQQSTGELSTYADPPDLEVMRLEVSSVLAQGGRASLFGEAQRPDGRLLALPFRHLGELYSEVALKEPYLRGARSLREVGVLWTDPLLAVARPEGLPYDRTAALKGALDALATAHRPYDVIQGWHLERALLDGYQVLLLPDVTCLDEAQAGVIRDWVHAGGRLLATGDCATHAPTGEEHHTCLLADVLGTRLLGRDARYAGNAVPAYLVAERHAVTAGLPDAPLALLHPHLRVEPTSAQVLGHIALPALAETPDRWINWGPAPPGEETGEAALLLNQYGTGQALYVTDPLFDRLPRRRVGGAERGDVRWPMAFLRAALGYLLPEPRIVVDGPEHLEATFFEQSQKGRLVVHLLNSAVRAWGGALPVANAARLRVRRELAGGEARLVWPPGGDVLPCAADGPYRVFDLPPTAVHAMVTVVV